MPRFSNMMRFSILNDEINVNFCCRFLHNFSPIPPLFIFHKYVSCFFLQIFERFHREMNTQEPMRTHLQSQNPGKKFKHSFPRALSSKQGQRKRAPDRLTSRWTSRSQNYWLVVQKVFQWTRNGEKMQANGNPRQDLALLALEQRDKSGGTRGNAEERPVLTRRFKFYVPSCQVAWTRPVPSANEKWPKLKFFVWQKTTFPTWLNSSKKTTHTLFGPSMFDKIF